MSAKFIHLHVHSEYSLLDGLSKIDNLVKLAKEHEMPSIALTDHGVMYGAVEFFKTCQKEGITPLIGMEGYVVNRDHKIKEGKAENHHLILLAKSLTGYKNLMKISTIAQLEGFYYRPRISKEVLRQYSQGLICTSACPKGELSQLLNTGNYEEAKKAASWFQEVFGPGNYYLEIQRHLYKDYFATIQNQSQLLDSLKNAQKTEDVWVAGIIKISRELGIPIVATNDAHYPTQSDSIAQDALVCISTGKIVSDTNRIRYVDTPTFYLRPEAQMRSLFSDLPDAVDNTLKVAQSCNLQLELGKWYFPKIDLPEGKDASQTLTDLVESRLYDRYPDKTKELSERIRFELETIISKGYAPYFLMMADLVNWCTNQGIITNTRGSAAGSVVSYIIGITTVDPLRYLLPFERFLNPFRPSPPDIDLDIADDRREELISFVTSKFGKDKVAQICTFGRMLARAAVRDVARVLGHPYAVGDRIAKVIPLGSQGFSMSIKRALDESPELYTMYHADSVVKQIIDLARQIEGNARHASVHAAGIVVSPRTMTDFTPPQLEPNGDTIITQYEMHACEDVGLVKFDILGIRNLSILGAARDIVEKERQIKIDLSNLPLDDKKTFAMLTRGDTMGVFQMGGSGMTKWLKELKPTRLEDLMVMIALFRPGPMANIPEFISRKHGKSKVTYLHPKMEKYLDKSYGILVYQDDVLFTALEIAGYDWNSVDKFRKAVGKKIPEEMAKQHEIFVKGCQKHSGMTENQAEKLWDLFVPFQGYGFNKAHAASYGIVSYQTAYLKANYPVEYMTALLTAESGNTEKVVEAIDECKRIGIHVLPPDINASETNFTIEPDAKSLDNRAIRFGLSAIKNVGTVAISIIFQTRNAGPYTSLTDFCWRVDTQKVNRKVLESLIKAGSLDGFGNRAAMLAALDKIRDMGTSISKMKSLGQESLFGVESQTPINSALPDIPEFDKTQKLGFEKELLGFYLTDHPHAEKLSLLTNHITHSLPDLYHEFPRGQIITTGGLIETCRNVVTKSGGLPMCFAKLSSGGKSVEVVVFPKTYAATPGVWQPDQVILVTGKVESKNENLEDESAENQGDITIIADSAIIFTGEDPPKSTSTPSPTPVTIYIPKNTPQSRLISLNSLLQSHKGSRAAILVFTSSSNSKEIPLPYNLDWTEGLKKQIDDLLKTPG